MARPYASAELIAVEARPMALDEPAFDLAYRAYAPRLRAVAYDVVRDRDAAEDVVHGALVRVWSAGAYKPQRGALLPFLIACVRREAFDALRAAKRRHLREVRAADDPVAPDETGAVDPVETRRVRAALDALPGAQRDVIVRAYYGHRTLAEVAHDTNTPIGTVKSRLAGALRRLHTTLSGDVTS
ncbi:MAG TPA: RNA polymerase sigma factor [Dongiaceae bacterium]|nr:RNA polymerase sigma factor [Dongiaceae bacterium]